MRFVFADAGYWIAVLDTDDVLHHIAQEMSDALRGVRILTTDMVLTEVASHFAGFGPGSRQAVAALLRDIGQSADVEVVPQTRALFDAALEEYARFADKQWSLVDCASFLVMRERGMTDALAHDHHFKQAGFRALLRQR